MSEGCCFSAVETVCAVAGLSTAGCSYGGGESAVLGPREMRLRVSGLPVAAEVTAVRVRLPVPRRLVPGKDEDGQQEAHAASHADADGRAEREGRRLRLRLRGRHRGGGDVEREGLGAVAAAVAAGLAAVLAASALLQWRRAVLGHC